MNTNIAYMCALASDAAYLGEEDFHNAMASYIEHRFTTKYFNTGGAQAYAFKPNKDQAVIVFRGTDSECWNDFLADIKAWQSESDVNGEVHSGFKHEVDKLEKRIILWIKSRAVNKETEVILTGHSLGAAMASIMCSRLHDLGYNVKLYTFGSPRVGDSNWANQFSNIEVHRFVNCNDIVCRVPLPPAYNHIGMLHYMTYDGKIKNDMTKYQRFKDQIRARLRAWRKLQFFSGVYDHSIDLYIYKIGEHV